MATSRAVGDKRERQARRFLQKRGLRILETNYHSRFGELDIVAFDCDCLVFVEVRYRARDRFGDAASSVNPRKQAKIVVAAQSFLASHPSLASHTCRFDVIGFDGNAVHWCRDAFRPQ